MKSVIKDNDIKSVLNEFMSNRESQNTRYASFDICYNYFYSHKGKLIGDNLESSCTQLWAYLGSWGMLRGSSKLLKSHSCASLKEIIEFISNEPEQTWHIDVDNYLSNSAKSIKTICNISKNISQRLKDIDVSPTITLVSKIMLGVFGNVPAFDTYFTKTFCEIYADKKCSFGSINEKALTLIANFYIDHKATFDSFNIKVKNFDGSDSSMTYAKAKLIDMFGFNYSLPQEKPKD